MAHLHYSLYVWELLNGCVFFLLIITIRLQASILLVLVNIGFYCCQENIESQPKLCGGRPHMSLSMEPHICCSATKHANEC